ncbi:MAG: serine/threonine-protein kinase [Acidobacteria bacterium]|nr:serine/threonine-protein kinase [Acidobacteriota bacterium]
MLTAGTQVGPYKIVALIGAGGMGEVYRALDPRLEREVAVKVLPARYAADADRLRRFEQEARTVGMLNHPNILAIYDVGVHEGVPYLVSELLEGETLGERIRGGPIPARKAIDFSLQIARGLAVAHQKGIAHRDLKPQNIFLTRGGGVKILDFGLAKLTLGEVEAPAPDQCDAPTKTGDTLAMGTVGYMAPERVRSWPADHRADIFSFGVILFEMLSGRRAFQGNSAVETMHAILHEDPLDPVPIQDLPPALERILRHCLEKAPDERAGGLYFGGLLRKAQPPSFQRLTFRRGAILSARFAPDGQTIVYGARWEGKPIELFSTRRDSTDSRALGMAGAEILAISSTGEMAVSLQRRFLTQFIYTGTLSRASLGGGAPREILEEVQEADWAPDGASLAVVRFAGGRSRLEYPIGKVLHESSGWISHARISQKGDVVAFLDHALRADDGGDVMVAAIDGKKRTVSKGWLSAQGLAWAPSGGEVWFTATKVGGARALYSVSLGGKERLVARVAGAMTLQDIARDGRILMTRDDSRVGMAGLSRGESEERDLSWLDYSFARGISADGKTILFDESGEGGGSTYAVFLRKMDGSPAVRLGNGAALGLSPDGRSVLALTRQGAGRRLTLLPTGPGEARPIEPEGITVQSAAWFPDGKRILVMGREAQRGTRLYVQDLAGGKPRGITPEGTTMTRVPTSPDGAFVIGRAPDRKMFLYPVDGGEPRPLAGVEPSDVPIQWSPGGRSLYVFRPAELPAKVYLVDLNGQRRFWKQLLPPDSTGLVSVGPIHMAQDGRAWVYSYYRMLSDLYLVSLQH